MNPDVVNPQYAMMVVIVGLSSLLSVASTVVAIYSNLRRKPPVQEEMYKEYARISQLEAVEVRLRAEILCLTTRHEKTVGEIFRVMRELQVSTDKVFTDISKAIGRVEGQLDEHTKKEGRA